MKFGSVVLFVVVGFAQTNAWFFSSPRIDPHEEVSQACRNLASSGSCAFYDCLERRFPCGHDGFTISVGKHFCTKMAAATGRLNAAGRVWANGTSQCLTSRLMQVYESYASRCDDIKDVGASGMAECNDRHEADGTDFCAFVRQNSDVYSDIFAASDIGRIISLRRPGLIGQLLVNGARCGATSLRGRLQLFSIDVENFFSSLQRRISSLFD